MDSLTDSVTTVHWVSRRVNNNLKYFFCFLKINRVGHYSVQLLSYGKELHDDSSEMILFRNDPFVFHRKKKKKKKTVVQVLKLQHLFLSELFL